MRLESLEAIKRRDHDHRVKEMLASINTRKQNCREVVYGVQKVEETMNKTNSKSAQFLEKVKKHANIDDDG
jgi:hypothetical protein